MRANTNDILRRNFIQDLGVLILEATLALCATLSLLIPRSTAAQASGPVAFTNATVIDGTGALPQEGATVTVEDSRIACVAELHTDHPESTT